MSDSPGKDDIRGEAGVERRQFIPGSHGAHMKDVEGQGGPPQPRGGGLGQNFHHGPQVDAVHGRLAAGMDYRQSPSRPSSHYGLPRDVLSPGSEGTRGWSGDGRGWSGVGWGPGPEGGGWHHHHIPPWQWGHPHPIPGAARDIQAWRHVSHHHGILEDSGPATSFVARRDSARLSHRPQTAQNVKTGGVIGTSVPRPRTSNAQMGRVEMTRPLTPSESGVAPTVTVGTDGSVSGFTISSPPDAQSPEDQDQVMFTHRVRRWKRVPVVGDNRLGVEGQVKRESPAKWSDSSAEVETLHPGTGGKARYQKPRVYMSLNSRDGQVQKEKSKAEHGEEKEDDVLNERRGAGDTFVVEKDSAQDPNGHVMLPAAKCATAGKAAQGERKDAEIQWSPEHANAKAEVGLLSSASKRNVGLISFDVTENVQSEVDQPVDGAQRLSDEHGHVNVVLEIVQAKDLEAVRMFGGCDSFVVVEVDDQIARTKVNADTRNPLYNEKFNLGKVLHSKVALRVFDKHARREKALYGLVEFKPFDILRRALGGQTDSFHYHEIDVWFVLQQMTGTASRGNLHILLKFEGYVDVSTLNDIDSKHVELATAAEIVMKGEILNSKGDDNSAYADILSMLQLDISLEEGCESNYFSTKSLGIFPVTSKFRILAFTFSNSKIFRFLSWLAAFAGVASMGFQPVRPGPGDTSGMQRANDTYVSDSTYLWIEFCSYIWLTFEIMVKCVATGVFAGARSFLRSSFFNVMDMLCLFVYWMEVALPEGSSQEFTLRPFRSFRVLTPLTQFKAFSGLTAIFMSLRHSFVGMAMVLLFLLFFSMVFGIFGVTFYQRSYSRRCTVAETGNVVIPERLCKIASDGEDSCLTGQICAAVGNDGPSHFDTIGYGLISMFQAISLDEQYVVMMRAMQSEPDLVAASLVFFLVATFFCRFVLFNVCVAIITATFQRVSREVDTAMKVIHDDVNALTESQKKIAMSLPPSQGIGGQDATNDAPPAAAACRDHEDTGTLRADEAKMDSGPGGDESALSGDLGAIAKVTDGSVKQDGELEIKTLHSIEEENQIHGHVEHKMSLHEIFFDLVNDPIFEFVCLSIVTLNTIAMVVNDANLSDANREVLSQARYYSQYFFILELILRMYGAASLSSFFSKGSDKFDFVVILIGSIEIVANLFLGVDRSGREMKILASLSALRFMRVVATLSTIQHLLAMTLASLANIFNLLLFTFAALSVFAICARYIFCSREWQQCDENGDFTSYWISMRTLYVLFTGDNVNELIHRTMNPPSEMGYGMSEGLAALFLMSFWFFAQGIIVNLYIAVIIENFSVMDTQLATSSMHDQGHAGNKGKILLKQVKRMTSKMTPPTFRELSHRLARVLKGGVRVRPEGSQGSSDGAGGMSDRAHTARDLLKMSRQDLANMSSFRSTSARPNFFSEHNKLQGSMVHPHARQMQSMKIIFESQKDMKQQGGSALDIFGRSPSVEAEEGTKNRERVFFVFEYDNPTRALARKISASSLFNFLILGAIVTSCVALAMEPPSRQYPSDYVRYGDLDMINIATTLIFTLEFLVQSLNWGLILHRGAYLRDPWNATDALVLLLSWLDITGATQTRQFRVLRLGRALRPLRLIKRNEGLRLIVDALIATWRPVSMIMVLLVAVTTVFGVIGMSMFQGMFHMCSSPLVEYPKGKTECTGTMLRGDDDQAQWVSPAVWDVQQENFDTFGTSFVTLLAVNTFNYGELLVVASDTTAPGVSPLKDNNAILAALFFVTYTIVSSLFVMNLFVAFIIDGFNQLRKADEVNREKKYIYKAFSREIRAVSPHHRPAIPRGRLRTWVREKLLTNNIYEGFFTACVFVNIGFLAAYNDGMGEYFAMMYETQNHLFFALMVVETFFAVLGKGWVLYLQDAWVYLDLVSIAASILAYFASSSTFIRSFRLIRVLRVVNNIPALRRTLATVAGALEQIGNVVLLMIIVFVMFAVLCVNFIGSIKEGRMRLGSEMSRFPADPPNFSSFPVAMIVLFQLILGDEWHQIMWDASVQPPECTLTTPDGLDGDCGVAYGGPVFIFAGFKVIAEFVLLNLFIGMMLDAFMKADQSDIEFHVTKAPFTAVKSSIRNVKKYEHDVEDKGTDGLLGVLRFKRKVAEANKVTKAQAEGLLRKQEEKKREDLKKHRQRRAEGLDASSSISRAKSGGSGTNRLIKKISEWAEDIEEITDNHGVDEKMKQEKFVQGEKMKMKNASLIDQSCVEVWKRVVGPERKSFLDIKDLSRLMRSLPTPLGFSRNAFGEAVISAEDKAVNKLIRAELNLIALHRYNAAQEPKGSESIISTIRGAVAVWLGIDNPRPQTSTHVSFDDVFMTLFHWRCQQYVPTEIQERRLEGIKDVVVTAHAILLAKLVRRWITVSRLKKQGILPAAGRRAMLGWVGEGAYNATVQEIINHPLADDSEDAKRSPSAC